jgi:hypothetical protein
MRGLIFFALSCTYAFGQIQFHLVDAPGSEKPVSTMVQVGAAPVGDRVDTVLRVRNTSQTQLVIRTLTLAGAAFSIFGQPSLPHTLAPGLNMDFTVRFAPRDYGSYSANLAVNGVGLLLAGSSTAAPVVSVDGTQRPAGSSIDLGLAERGASTSKTFRLENTTSERVRIQAVTITGKHFKLNQDMPLPIELAPRTGIDLNVVFAPTASGVFEGSLVIDGRTFRLTAAAHEPPFPKPAIVIDLPNPTSAQQGKVSLQFGEGSRAIGSGKLRMEFRPLAAAAPDDEAVRFVKGARANSFEVTEGVTVPVSEMTFQTGTTAGTIVFVAEVGGWTATASVDINPERVHIDKLRAIKNGSMLEVEITGFDNTRTLNQLAFTFLTSNGDVIQPGAIRVDTTADFGKYFANSTLGGSFTLKAIFPVAGVITNIASTQVEVTNSSGVAQTGKAAFQ